MRRTLILFYLLISIVGYSQKKDNFLLTTYSNKDFEISYPKKWNLDTILHYPDIQINNSDSHQGRCLDIISIFSQTIPSQYDNFDNFVNDCETQVKEIAYDNIINQKLVVQNNRTKYFKMIYYSDQGNTCNKIEQRYYLTKHKIFVITITTDSEIFDSVINIEEKVMDSFILKVQ